MIKYKDIVESVEKLYEKNDDIGINDFNEDTIVINLPTYDEESFFKKCKSSNIISRFPLSNIKKSKYKLEPYKLDKLDVIYPLSFIIDPLYISISNVYTMKGLYKNGKLLIAPYEKFYNCVYNNELTLIGYVAYNLNIRNAEMEDKKYDLMGKSFSNKMKDIEYSLFN